jgi:hypothetical protein
MYTNICKGCNNAFDTDNIRQTRCRKDCGRVGHHAVRHASRAAHDVRFVGVDGEGVTLPNGEHHYVLLSVGDQSLSRRGDPLHYDEIFEFLYEQFLEDPNAAYVGFFLGYDFTQWLKTITVNRAEMLLSPKGIASRQPHSERMHQPFMVTLGQTWDIDVLAQKRFKLRPHAGYNAKSQSPTMYVCDAGPFFQTSFLNVIDPAGWPASDYPISDRDYQVILEGKNERATAQYDSKMVRYNVTENRALSAVMGHLNKGFVSAGVRLNKNQWFGPGQAASYWLVDHCDHTSELVRECVPLDVVNSAIASYYGGWFEIFAHGLVPGTSYENDLNSAYPWAISELPCLLHGRWEHNARRPGKLALEHVTLASKTTLIGAAPYRNADGSISRPHQVTGWYWKDEVDALVKAGIARRVKRHESWTYHPCPCPPPLRDVKDLYLQRIVLGEEGKNSPQGKALKLLYNSMYGKFAQSVGKPRFANPVFASRITSQCRTRIIEAIGSHPGGLDELLMVATDAVFFRSPHTGLTLSSTELGLWSETKRENLTLMMPGVYWDDVTRDRIRDGKSPKLKSRGISAKALAACIDQVDDAFATFAPVAGQANEWPTVEIPLNFAMVTATQAVARHKWETAGLVSQDVVRRMSADPTVKRDPTTVYYDRGVLRTQRWGFAGESHPYDRRFGMDFNDDRANDPWSPEGNLSVILHDAFSW